MNKGLKILTIAVLACSVTIAAFAGSVWNAADTASPFAIRFKDADVTGTLTVTSNTFVMVDDSNTNTITIAAAYNTLSEVIAGINAATNTSGVKNFEAVYWAGIAADTVLTNYVDDLAATTLTRQWNFDVEWDTSVCLHYDSAVGTLVGTTPVAAGKIDHIFGDPIGTGDVTLTVYVDGSTKWSRLITSPTYASGSLYTNMVAEPSVVFDFEVNIPVGSQPAFVRAARATTATTGGIGISDTRR